MYNRTKAAGWTLFTLLVSNVLIMTIAYPQVVHPQHLQLGAYRQQQQQQQQQHQSQQRSVVLTQQQLSQQQKQQQQPLEQAVFTPVYRPQASSTSSLVAQERPLLSPANEGRKFAVKPNASKKVALDDIDEDITTNQIEETPQFAGWLSNALSSLFQLFFNYRGYPETPSKSEDLDGNGTFSSSSSPWANLISVGLKIITTILGGGAPINDGIDKVDNGGTPMQAFLAAVLSTLLGTKDPEQVNSMAKQANEFINIVVNLLDALKTSFSHRSMAARSLGKRDSVSDAAVAGISMLKSYAKTYRTTDDKCMQKYLCEANSECISEIGGSSIFCQLGTYATSFVLEKTSGNRFETLYDAGRRGRSGENCRQIYLECNEV